MGLTTDPNDPGLRQTRPDGQQSVYLVLPEEERARGFVRPVRTAYKHVGCRPNGPVRPLTDEERERYARFGYECFEEYGPERDPVKGRFWTKEQLRGGCGTVTTMGQALAETYAAQPGYYGATYCCGCRKHLPVGLEGEFVWVEDGEATDQRVGT